MKETDVRVVETLSRSLPGGLSISRLTDEIQGWHGTGHYKNVHGSVERLASQGALRLEREGGSSRVSLELGSLATVDLLAEVDLLTKRRARPATDPREPTPSALASLLQQEPMVTTAFLVDEEASRALNRMEVVIVVGSTEDEALGRGEGGVGPDGEASPERLTDLHRRISDRTEELNTRVDLLVIAEDELIARLSGPRADPVQALVGRRTALVDPQRLWWLVHRAQREGRSPRSTTGGEPRDGILDVIAGITEEELAWNLPRYGYTEMGAGAGGGRELPVELVIAALLRAEDPRRRYATTVLLTKNPWNPRILAFLATKHNLQDDLSAFLGTLGTLAPSPRIQAAQRLIRQPAEEVEIDREQVQEMLDLYAPTPGGGPA